MALHKRLCNPLGFDFEFALSKTTVNGAFINRFEKPRFLPGQDQPQAPRNRLFGIEPRGLGAAARMRMIMPHHRGAAAPHRLVRRQQAYRIEFETPRFVGRDIGDGLRGIDPRRRPEQQAADLLVRACRRMGEDLIEHSP